MEKSLGNNPLTRCPESSVTLTGTITWLTLRVILNSSSCDALPASGVALPCGTVFTSTGCGASVVPPSGADGGGLADEGGVSLPAGTCSSADGSLGGAPCGSTGGAVGNGWGGRLADGASGISCFWSGCCCVC